MPTQVWVWRFCQANQMKSLSVGGKDFFNLRDFFSHIFFDAHFEGHCRPGATTAGAPELDCDGFPVDRYQLAVAAIALQHGANLFDAFFYLIVKTFFFRHNYLQKQLPCSLVRLHIQTKFYASGFDWPGGLWVAVWAAKPKIFKSSSHVALLRYL